MSKTGEFETGDGKDVVLENDEVVKEVAEPTVSGKVEIKAIGDILTALKDIPKQAQARIILYVIDKQDLVGEMTYRLRVK